MTVTLESRKHRFAGANIKGTPKMSAESVREDVLVIRDASDVAVVQEFKWFWYWGTLIRVVGKGKWKTRWSSSPGFARGKADPQRGAQACLWSNAEWKKVRSRVWVLHRANAYSATRYIRAVLLEDRDTGQRCWFVTTHFVVGGDNRSDPIQARNILRHDIITLGRFLNSLGDKHPIVCQLDANIGKGSQAYAPWMDMLKGQDAKVHGEHGVEYLFTIDGTDAKVKVEDVWIIGGARLNTDHEVRGITFRLVS